LQDVTEKIEQHKDIIDANNKSFYEMKKAKDAKQNERKYVGSLSHSFIVLFCAVLWAVVRSSQRNYLNYTCSWVLIHVYLASVWLLLFLFFMYLPPPLILILLIFWHAPIGVLSATRRHQPSQGTVLGQVECFVYCEVVCCQIVLDGVQPRDTWMPWWSLPVI